MMDDIIDGAESCVNSTSSHPRETDISRAALELDERLLALSRIRSARVKEGAPLFFNWMWGMLTEPSLSTAEKLHAAVLAMYADWDTGEGCRPSREDVSAIAGIEPRTIKKHMQHFRDLGLVETTIHGGKNRAHTSRLLSPVVLRGTSQCTPIDPQGYTPHVPLSISGVHLGASQGYIPVHPSLPTQLPTHTTLRPDAHEPPTEEATTTTTTTKPTRADDWRKALAGDPSACRAPFENPHDLDKLAEVLFTTANGAMARGLPGLEVLSEPIRWLESGADLHLDVLPVIKARVSRARPGSIRTWGYFGAAVFEARDARTAPPPEPKAIDRSNNKGYTEPTKEENDDFWARLSAKIKEKENAKSNGSLPEAPKAIF